MRILAIDDIQDNLTTLKAVIRDALPGCDVLTAVDGPRGIELARGGNPDVILLDIAMPGMDGYAVCRQLKADERLREIPVLFLTALRTDQESRVRALEAGGEGFLTKPWEQSELVAQIRAMARIRAANRRQRLESEDLAALVAERTRELDRELAERRRAEERLRISEAQYRSLAENSPDGVARFDRQCRFLYANAAAARVGRLAPAEYVGLTLEQSGAPAAAARRWEERIRAVFETGVTLAVEDAFETPGGPRYYDTRFVPEFAPDGSVHSVQAIARDISARKEAEAVLRESERKYRELVERANSIILHWTRNGLITFLNEFGQRFFGYSDADLLGRHVVGTIVPETESTGRDLRPLMDRICADPQAFEHNVNENMRRNGERVWIDWTNRVDLDEHGRVSGILSIGTDITERKRASSYREMGLEALQALGEPGSTHAALQRVLAVLKARTGFDAVGIRLQDGDDFPYTVQQGFSKEFLLTEDSLLERGADGGVCRNEDGTLSLACTCGLVIAGRTDPSHPLFTRGGSFWTNDSSPLLELTPEQDPRHRPRNQCIHLGYASVALVPIRARDRIVGLIHLNDRRRDCFTLESVELMEGVAAHIGAALLRRQAEDATRESEKLLRESQFVGGLGSYALDIPSGVWASSAALDEVFGIDAAYERSVAGWVALIHPDERRAMETYFRDEVLGRGQAFDRQYRIVRHHDRAERWVHGRGSLGFGAEGRPVRMVGTIQDITDRIQAEKAKAALEAQLQQAQKMDSVGRLAGGVAHDFNNLLTGIMNYVELCRDELPPGHPTRRYLDEITIDAKRSADITQQLLAFARKQVVAPKVLDLNDALAGMLKMLRHLMGEDIGLTWTPGASLWPVRMDPGQLNQILANLCVNARDAIAGVGKVAIETANVTLSDACAAAHADATPGEYVRLVVSDNGCGMGEDVISHLFEPFFTTKEVGKGTGLGLATVHGIVKQNSGHIEVNSAPGKGAAFTIYLPRVAPEGGTDAGAAVGAGLPRGTETILLAEDERSVRITSRAFLEQLGYTVLVAETPAEALRLAGAHSGPIHLLITDVIMPGMNGPDLAGFLAGECPRLKSLFISGYTADVMTDRGTLGAGMPFLPKPFSRGDLARKVRAVLDAS